MRAGWSLLGIFWLTVLVVAGAGAGALQAMGPPAPTSPALAPVQAPVPQPAEAAAPAHTPQPVSQPWPGPPIAQRAAVPGQIAPPDPALLESAPDFPGAFLPRIATDGRKPDRVYIRQPDAAPGRPRVAMLIVGLGLDAQASRTAAETLPGAITLGVSPYARDPEPLMDDIRSHGHEFLLTVPMESQGYPLNDSGPHALLTGANPADNARNLEWALSRIEGYAGITGASDGLRGERFAASPSGMGGVLGEAAKRGLLYVDPRPHAAVSGAAVAVTNVLDDQTERAAVDASLTELEQKARDGGAALGVALRTRPATIERIAAWARELDARGIALVPVSALVPNR